MRGPRARLALLSGPLADGYSARYDADMMRLMFLLSLALLSPCVLGQRPKTENDAVDAFRAVRSSPERLRHGAARDLGRFAGGAATAALCAELDRAETASYTMTVVRAIGAKARQGAVTSLVAAFERLSSARLLESVAEALRRQSTAGIDALVVAFGETRDDYMRRQAICYALARVADHEGARDALCAELKVVAGAAQRMPLQALAAWRGDSAVDALRVEMAGAKNLLVASAAVQQLADHRHEQAHRAALQLARRLDKGARTDVCRAALSGLLCDPSATETAPVWRMMTFADRAFEQQLAERWSAALREDAFFKALDRGACESKDARVRAAAARALALAPDQRREDAKALLGELLRDKDASVVRAACSSVAAVGAKDELVAALVAGSAEHQAARIVTLFEGAPMGPLAAKAMASIEPGLKAQARAAWLQALVRGQAVSDSERARVAVGHLNHRDWRVRAAAFELAVAAPTKAAVGGLIDRFRKEKGRLRHDAWTALNKITGAGFVEAKQWQSWWKTASRDIEIPTKSDSSVGAPPQGTGAAYWDMPIYSTRLTFVVDTSGSMNKPFGTGDTTRLVEAKRQLRSVFERLPKGSSLNVVGFSTDAVEMFDRLQPLSARRRKAAGSFVEELVGKGPTNVFASLESAFADPAVDTIFLLTDGRPSSGSVADVATLAKLARLWNAGRLVRIHTISLGEASELLKQLAADSGGVYRVAR